MHSIPKIDSITGESTFESCSLFDIVAAWRTCCFGVVLLIGGRCLAESALDRL
jgi:hypothetical protein